MLVDSQRDDIWSKYIIPDKLYDNMFLCAYLNLYNIDVNLIDEKIYNYPGFYTGGEIKTKVHDGQLVYVDDITKKLKIVHFAGIKDPALFLRHIDKYIAAIILNKCIDSDQDPFDMLIKCSTGIYSTHYKDDFVVRVYNFLIEELIYLYETGLKDDYSTLPSYFQNREALISYVYTLPKRDSQWKGLRAGGAYLDEDEYEFILEIIKKYKIKSVIETGAGETTRLFNRLKLRHLAVEAFSGVWLNNALSEGCNAVQIDFDFPKIRFDDEKLLNAIGKSFFDRKVDLIFIDSPIGTHNRSEVLNQIAEHIDFKFALFHDVFRDSINIYSYQKKHGLVLKEFHQSIRGMVLLAKE